MTEQRRLDADSAVPSPRPIPDLGFFAPGGGQSTQFSAPSPASVPSQFGAPSALTAPPSQFGAPSPFGGPGVTAPRTPPGGRTSRSPWLVVAAAGALLGLLALVIGGRFAWSQFVADPVLPHTLLGLPRLQGAEVDAQMAAMSAEMRDELSDGSKVEVGIYTDGQGTGYVVMAIRGGSRPGSGDDSDDFSGWTKSEHDGVQCQSSPPTAAAGLGATLCIEGFFRRAVAVFALGLVPPDPATVARATSEAWDAQ